MDTAINQQQTIEISENFIDLEKIISGKSPRLLKVIPTFILSYIKNIIHLKELNAAIYRNRNVIGIDFATEILKEFGVKINVFGIENIPLTGRYIVASNHPLGGMDGMALISRIGAVRPDIMFPVNDLLMNLPQLKPIFIPINKHGKNTDNIKILEETFASDVMILYFPAGLCSRKQKKGIIKDMDWKKTFITKSKRYQRDVIPVYIDGKNTNFFYNLSKIRKNLGIKANIEMLYLVDEMYKQKDKTINIIIGKPITYLTFDKKFSDQEWAEKMKEKVYKMSIESVGKDMNLLD